MGKYIFLVVFTVMFFFAGILEAVRAQESELKFAITAAVGSDPDFTNYRELTAYISNQVGKKSVFVSGLSYEHVDNLFMNQQIDVGFLCNTHYARRKDDVNFTPLAAPIVLEYGKPKFQIYLIVHKDSDITSIDDLRDKVVDLSDPLSTTTIYTADMLIEKEETIITYFKAAIYSGSHDMTVQLVANKMVDAGFIDGHIWDYHDKAAPRYSAKTKIIHRSQDFTIPPVVVSNRIDETLKKDIKRILLTMHTDPGGKKILNKLRIDKFMDIKPKDYHGVYQLYLKVKDRI